MGGLFECPSIMQQLFLTAFLFVSISSNAQPILNKILENKKEKLIRDTIDSLKKAPGKFKLAYKNRKLKPTDIEKLKKIENDLKMLNEVLAKKLVD